MCTWSANQSVLMGKTDKEKAERRKKFKLQWNKRFKKKKNKIFKNNNKKTEK